MEKKVLKVSRTKKTKNIIAICASVSFYHEVLEIEKDLEKRGFQVLIPYTATRLKKEKDFDLKTVKSWLSDEEDYGKKANLMRKHFREVEKSDAILVVNLTKKRQRGYIGGNVLIEMALAFYLQKKIFLLRKPNAKSPFYEEIMGVRPIIIDGNLTKIL